MDHALVSDILSEIEDEDDTATGKKGLKAIEPAAEPVKTEGGDKLAELVASLSPEEKAKLRSLLDADDKAKPPEA